MNVIDETIPIILNETFLNKIAVNIKELFPKNLCYFIGSICHDNIGKSDIDFIVLTDKAITVTELRLKREQVNNIDSRLQMMICFSEDQTDLKKIPYISMQDVQDKKIIDKNDFSESEFNDFKDELYTHLWKKRKYNKSIIKDSQRKEMRKKTIIEKMEYLKNYETL